MADFAVLQEIVAGQLGVPKEKVTQDATFQDDLGADSLDLVELIMAVEEKFNVEIADDEAQAFASVGDVWKFISKS